MEKYLQEIWDNGITATFIFQVSFLPPEGMFGRKETINENWQSYSTNTQYKVLKDYPR